MDDEEQIKMQHERMEEEEQQNIGEDLDPHLNRSY